MADPKEIPADANGVPLASARKKVIAPLPEADELVIVMILDKDSGQQTYNYVDPTTALQCDRLAHDMRVTYPDGRFVMSKAQEWGADKYVRETVSAGYTMWPAQGYLVVKLEQLGILGPQPQFGDPVPPEAVQETQPVWPDASVTSAGPAQPENATFDFVAQEVTQNGVPVPQTIPEYAEAVEAAVVLDPQTYATQPAPAPAALVLDPSGQYAWDGVQWVPYAAPVPPPPPMPPAPPVPPAPVAAPGPPPAPAPVPDATVLQFPPQAPPAPPMPPQMPAPVAPPAAPVAPSVPAGAPVPPPLPGLPGVPPLPPAPTPN